MFPLNAELLDSGLIRSFLMFFQAHITKTLGLALMMLGLTGCSIWRFDSFQDPQVHLLKVQVVKARLTQQDFKLHFRIDNPNDSRLLVRGLQYKVMLNDVMLAEGKASDWFFVAAHSQKNFVVPIQTNLWRHAKYIGRLLKRPDKAIHYQLEGKLKTGIVFRHSVHIGRSGEVVPDELIQHR
jgi:LEA14-like dessication related protein